jgi:hypothetical protein
LSRDGTTVAWTQTDTLLLFPFLAQETHVGWASTDSPSGRHYATVNSVFMPIGPCAGAGEACGLELSPDGRRLAFVYVSGLRVVDLATGKIDAMQGLLGQVISYRWTGNTELAAVLWTLDETSPTRLVRYTLPDFAPHEVLAVKDKAYVARSAWSNDARHVVISASEGYAATGPCRIINTSTGATVATLGDESRFAGASWTADGRRICLLQRRTADKGPRERIVTEARVLVYDLETQAIKEHVLTPPADQAEWNVLTAVWTGGDRSLLVQKVRRNDVEWVLMDPDTGEARSIQSRLEALLKTDGRIEAKPLSLPGYVVAAGDVNGSETYAVAADLTRADVLTTSRTWSISPDLKRIAEQGPWGPVRVRALDRPSAGKP